MSIYFTSDSHMGHANIIEYCKRPFSSVEEMNEVMTANWNSVVKPEDTVIHLGDFALGKKDLWPGYAAALNGHKVLVMGNHDKVDKTLEKSIQRFKDLGFERVEPEDLYITELGTTFWCSHIPQDNSEDKREYKRPKATQPYNISLCGHIHDRWTHNLWDINVGVDQWDFIPQSAETIIKYAKNIGHYR